MWEIIDTGFASAEENMRIDSALLDGLDLRDAPILHFYDWELPSATYGLLVKPEDFLDVEKVERGGIQLARRPTGGGITFHLWDFAFSILVPATSPHFSSNPIQNYAFVHRALAKVIDRFLGESLCRVVEDSADGGRFCMAKATRYDLTIKGKKVVGAAQRLKRQGFLHQGMISLLPPEPEVLRPFLKGNEPLLQAILEQSHPLLGSKSDLKGAQKRLKDEIIREFMNLDA